MRLFRKGSTDAGSGLVELALALAVILTLLFGIIDVGRALYAYNWVSNAARLGTRYMMVRGLNCNQQNPNLSGYPIAGGCPATSTDVTNYINTQAIGIDTSPSKLTVNVTCIGGAGVNPTPPCGVGGGGLTDYVQVQVQYKFSFISPFAQFIPAWTMSSSSERAVLN